MIFLLNLARLSPAMMKLKLIFLLLLNPLLLLATHIVGGEIELIRSNFPGSSHQLSLNLYFDAINGNPQAEDASVTLSVFRKRDNLLLGTALLPKVVSSDVLYQNPSCGAIGGLKTKLIRYSDFVLLDATAFNDEGGYYIIWERCCRNNVISNILRPEGAAMTFYLEFASLTQNNAAFINSSPVFDIIKTDYLCLNQPFKLTLAGKDIDNDKLVYSLQTPLNGYATSAIPNPARATGSSNYPTVNFVPGISVINMIPGQVPLTINPTTGEIFVTPDRVGLFVFSVLVEEFRNGVKIGLQRRDFQLKVVDCILNQKPQIFAREDSKSVFIGKQNTIDIQPKSNVCINLLLTDQNVNQELNWKIIADTQDSKFLSLLSTNGIVKTSTDTIRSTICLDQCIFGTATKIVPIKLVAYDNGCPLPLTDTLQFNLRIAPSNVTPPTIQSTLPNNIADLPINNKIQFNIIGADTEKTDLLLEAIGVGFDIKLTNIKFQTGVFTSNFQQPFEWTPTCADYSKQKSYSILFRISKTVCGRVIKDSINVKINLLVPQNISPKIDIGNLTDPIEIIVDPNNLIKIEFPVTLSDQNLEQNLTLTGQGNGFAFSTYGMKFTDVSGNSLIKSTFSWTPNCQDVETAKGKVLEIIFKGSDQSCSPNSNVETLKKVILKSPEDLIIKSLPNVITPNNDGKNDYFSLENIPLGTCNSIFKEVIIQNRWGSELFKSNDKNFIWGSKETPVGQYYYQIIYTNKTYKGHITILN